jgi:hypothetical protein
MGCKAYFQNQQKLKSGSALFSKIDQFGGLARRVLCGKKS